MGGLHYLFAFLIAIGVLVVVHELGHYAVARWAGVKVLRFSFGFGKTIFVRRMGRDGTEWAIGTIPLGGYVKMLDEREGPVPAEERSRAFNTQSVARRALIVLAGPVSNLLLAVVIYWGMALAGTKDLPAVVGDVTNGSVASRAGLMHGDRVMRVDGEPVVGWSSLRWAVMDHALSKGSLDVDVDRGGVEVSGLSIDLSSIEIGEQAPDVMQQVGISLPQPKLSPIVGKILAGSAAERGGLRVGDLVRRVDGRPITYWYELVGIVSRSPGKLLEVDVSREGREQALKVIPDSMPGNPSRGRIGVQVRPDEAAMQQAMIDVSYDVFDGLVFAVGRTYETAAFSLKVMWRMITGSVSLRNVSGPVTIADYAGQSAAIGIEAYLGFLALVSISIGVLNLLPIPILDGGHLLYYVLEILRGKPLPERLEEYGQKLGLVFLAGLMSLAVFNDLNRIFFG